MIDLCCFIQNLWPNMDLLLLNLLAYWSRSLKTWGELIIKPPINRWQHHCRIEHFCGIQVSWSRMILVVLASVWLCTVLPLNMFTRYAMELWPLERWPLAEGNSKRVHSCYSHRDNWQGWPTLSWKYQKVSKWFIGWKAQHLIIKVQSFRSNMFAGFRSAEWRPSPVAWLL